MSDTPSPAAPDASEQAAPKTEELFRTDARLTTCEARVVARTDQGLVLDRTVFYPLGGGQPGDTGHLTRAGGASLAVTDTRYGPQGEIVHQLGEDATPPDVGETVTATIDWERRHRLMRMHTCLHLICALIDGKITGANVGDGKGRVDFDLPEAPDKAALTDRLNALIAEDRPVSVRWITDTDLDAQPELVRTLTVMPPRGSGRVRLVEIAGLDLQPCGGTHVDRLGDIGPVVIQKIEKKGRLNRRIAVAFAQT